jgi:hypothetical protein
VILCIKSQGWALSQRNGGWGGAILCIKSQGWALSLRNGGSALSQRNGVGEMRFFVSKANGLSKCVTCRFPRDGLCPMSSST